MSEGSYGYFLDIVQTKGTLHKQANVTEARGYCDITEKVVKTQSDITLRPA